MNIPKPKALSSAKPVSQHSAFEAREAERRKKDDLEREKKRIEREKNALFGDESFVVVRAPTPQQSVEKKVEEAKSMVNKPSEAFKEEQAKKSGGVKISAPVAVNVKKTGIAGAGSNQSGTGNAKIVAVAQVKRAGAPNSAIAIGSSHASSAALNQSKSSASTTLHAGAASYKPPPLPEVKYVKKSALPSLAEWRASAGGASKPSSSKDANASKGPFSRVQSQVKRNNREVEDESSEEEEEDEDSEEETEEERRARLRRKRKAEEMDRMWAELRAITGYNPNDPKYRQRDRYAISESTFDDLQSEERRSRLIGRKEDEEEEENERKRAMEKKRRLRDWKRRNGESDDDDDDDDDDEEEEDDED